MKSHHPNTEPAYRRGYSQGYHQAVKDMRAEQDPQAMVEHVSVLMEWRDGSVSTLPPTVESSSPSEPR